MKTKYTNKFGKMILQIKEEKNLTYKDMAKMTKASMSNIRNAATGTNSSFETIMQIARPLKIDLNKL